jgi:hypothetical protein
VHNVITGNLLYHPDPGKGAVRLPQPEVEGLVCRDNLVSDRFSVNGGASVISLADWQALGYGQGSRVVAREEVYPPEVP